MSSHLALVGSKDHDCHRLAEIVQTIGGATYRRLRLIVEQADDMTLTPTLAELTERELTAAALYAAFVGDDYVGSLLTFEEGRRCGLAEAHANEDGGPLERPAV